jgi:hypothetical protein
VHLADGPQQTIMARHSEVVEHVLDGTVDHNPAQNRLRPTY